MKYHILNGDALLAQVLNTPVAGQYIVLREALVDGKVLAQSLDELWVVRAGFFEEAYGMSKKDYFSKSVAEISKIQKIPKNSSVYLWFERDLFCQVNLWFTIHYMKRVFATKFLYPYLVLPNHNDWSGFGNMTPDELISCYDQKIELRKKEMKLFSDLWKAYQYNNLNSLKQLSVLAGKSYPYLGEVVEAHLDRSSETNHQKRPYKA